MVSESKDEAGKFVYLPLNEAANAPSASLADWGFRAGAGDGECKIDGVVHSKANGVKTGINYHI